MNEPNKRLAIENSSSRELMVFGQQSLSGYSYLTSYTTLTNKEYRLYCQVKKYKGNNQKYYHIILRINHKDFWCGKVTQSGSICWNSTGSKISQVFYPSSKSPELELTDRLEHCLVQWIDRTRDRLPINPPLSKQTIKQKQSRQNKLRKICSR